MQRQQPPPLAEVAEWVAAMQLAHDRNGWCFRLRRNGRNCLFGRCWGHASGHRRLDFDRWDLEPGRQQRHGRNHRQRGHHAWHRRDHEPGRQQGHGRNHRQRGTTGAPSRVARMGAVSCGQDRDRRKRGLGRHRLRWQNCGSGGSLGWAVRMANSVIARNPNPTPSLPRAFLGRSDTRCGRSKRSGDPPKTPSTSRTSRSTSTSMSTRPEMFQD